MKKIFTPIALTATLLISSLPVSAIGNYPVNTPSIEQYTVLDDKGMLSEKDFYKREGYKFLYDGDYLYRAMPAYRSFSFVLNEGVDFENVDTRVNEIFREFYPEENYNDEGEYVPFINAITSDDGITIYTSYFSNKPISSASDEIVTEAKKHSKDIMEKLNDEKLISAFYDFGEVYDIVQQDKPYDLLYWATDDITLVNEYIKENNINCTMEKISDYFYELVPTDDMDVVDKFNLAVDIYEETSIKIKGWGNLEDGFILYGENSLKENSSTTIPVETTVSTITPSETTETTVSTTTTTGLTTTPIVTTVITTTSEVSAIKTTSNITTTTTEPKKITGDANGDNEVDVRDCAFIASKLADGISDELSEIADYNDDGKVNVRDAAAIAKHLASK